ncbi:MAG: bifunctional methylenetetrahydrofolate dehydrogenase/methenyltetrahydrofolate cyclohydrolase FolD [Polyangiales bacterium]
MTALLLDGKEIAATVRREVASEVEAFVRAHGRAPGLHVVLCGDDPASAVYVRNKEKAAREIGIAGEVHRLAPTTTEAELVALVRRLNADPTVDGILVQLPLFKSLASATEKVLELVDPAKDVDGFHPINVGLLSVGRPALVPCTPTGCMRLIDEAVKLLAAAGRKVDLAGARAVVVGRSNIVGKPVAQLLLARHATVTLAHSRTRDLAAVCREADVLVAAVGKADLIGGGHVRDGAIVIDVGMNRVATPDGKGRLVGDVSFDAAREKAGAITPVPGGVGPMTIAYLLKNTVDAGMRRLGPG